MCVCVCITLYIRYTCRAQPRTGRVTRRTKFIRTDIPFPPFISSLHLSVEHTTLSPSSSRSPSLPYDICFFNVFFLSFFLFAVDFFAFDDRRSTCGKRLKRTFRRKRYDFILFFFFLPKTERLFSFDTIDSISYLHTVGVKRTYVIRFGGRREQCV